MQVSSSIRSWGTRDLTFRIMSLASTMFLNPDSPPGSISTCMHGGPDIHVHCLIPRSSSLQDRLVFTVSRAHKNGRLE